MRRPQSLRRLARRAARPVADRARRLAPAAALAVALAAAAGCATSGGSPGVPPGESAGEPSVLPRLVCGQGSQHIDLRATGVPQDVELLDVALGGDRIWVLGDDRFLAEVPRSGGGSARFLRGRDDTPPWDALAVDPEDGSLWIVSRSSFDLLHFDATTGRTRRVTVERATGPGGFSDVAVGEGVVYVTPTCSDRAVWTIDPADGRLVARDFTAAPTVSTHVEGVHADAAQAGCAFGSLATGPGGTVYASASGAVYRPGADGWAEVPALSEPGMAATALRGLDIGERTETWFFENTRGFFFLDGDPVWVGGAALSAARDRRGALLFRRGVDGGLIPHLEPCLGWFPTAYDSDDDGYVFLTDDGLVFSPAQP